jgi:tetratricopeptide (TPR) repeat protein
MEMSMKKFSLNCILVILWIFAGCKNDTGGGETADQLVNDGWQAYVSKDYKTAVNKFNQAITMNGSLVDAYNGAGWSYALLNRLDTSVIKFTSGRSHDSTNAEINAGLGFVENALKSYQPSIQFAGITLQQNATWTFSKDNTINWCDLRVLLAEDYFALSQYNLSLTNVQFLKPSFTVDTTTIAGRIELSQQIDSLRSQYGN